MIRLSDAPVCPKCGASVGTRTDVRTGERWAICAPSRSRAGTRALGGHRTCGARWLEITLPPGTTGATLVALLGTRDALALLRTALPELARLSDALLAAATIVPAEGGAPAYLQIPVAPSVPETHRYAPLPDVLALAGLRKAG